MDEPSRMHEPGRVDEPQRTDEPGSIVAATYQAKAFGATWFEAETGLLRVMEDLAEYEAVTVLSQRTLPAAASHSCPRQ